ncbi:MFS transporter [Streptococcus pseudoporcinus]|uniref:Transporter, major facilitator family protein n=1 Tax=Streptococcus pseudoporcinus LQ 940-04 TaxID=875093 RepID=G5KA56_9STRE|nr:MFS transporter [Streptococcus pseudoporcinus]EFR45139.1 transporter, major facilitator family protein [Streptococcus pseudoporcinus SPIN 20026]EHI64240.1 transporter, major facilitator family protein [Streptococcus pseudoporcinus LQ 940-04]VEF93579.1 Major Facilitator Superfamily protein [Streptococcus pseudoporcinus]
MKSFLEKMSLLSLSVMMISPFSVAPALPQMLSFYEKQGYIESNVSILFSLSSFSILAVLLANPLLRKVLNEKQTVILGLLLIALGGGSPMLTQSYAIVFISRLLLGLGIGLINAKAINIISERYTGKEKIKLLGFRSSVEVLGAAVFTFLAGFLISFGWSKAFAIYFFALIILGLYLLFVPKIPEVTKVEKQIANQRLNSKQLLMIVGMAIYAGFVIVVNTSITLRIPLVIAHNSLGSAGLASLILSLMMLMGIFSGLSFSGLLARFKDSLMAIVAIALGIGMLILWVANSLFLVALGALLTGFVYSVGVTYVFHHISEKIPSHQLTNATTLVLLGCNIGGGGAALILQVFSYLSSSLVFPYLIYALLSLALGLLLLLKSRRKIGQP